MSTEPSPYQGADESRVAQQHQNQELPQSVFQDQVEWPTQLPGYITVPRKDWQYVHTCVDSLKQKLPMALQDATTWMVAFLGMAVASSLALLPLFNGGQHPSSVTITIFVFAIFTFCLCAGICAFFRHQGNNLRNSMIDDVTKYMDDTISAHYGNAQSQITSSSTADTTMLQFREDPSE